MSIDDYEEPDERTTRTARRGPQQQTERLSQEGADYGEPMREDWRRSRRSTTRTRRNQTLPFSREEFVLWLQHGGWRIVAAAAAVVFIIVLLLILNRRATTPATNQALDNTVPTAGVGSSGLIVPTAGSIATTVPPTAASAPQGAQFQVVNTGTDGLFLRSSPDTNNTPVTTLPEGTMVTIIGDDSPGPNFTWKHVRTADGQEGWVSGEYLQQSQ